MERSLYRFFAALAFLCSLVVSTVLARAPFDFDGDGKTDVSIYRRTTGEWWYKGSLNGNWGMVQFGTATDKIVPADYTGDGKDDFAFYRPSSGEWFVLRSENYSYYAFQFGISTDVPIPADYDGDGKADAAVYRPSDSTWYVLRSNGSVVYVPWGTVGDRPALAGDFDGDGKADYAVMLQCCNFKWSVYGSSVGPINFDFLVGTTPIVGDFSGDGKADAASYNHSQGQWSYRRSEDGVVANIQSENPNGCRLAPGDYDGDGKFDPGIFIVGPQPNWYIKRSSDSVVVRHTFGLPNDNDRAIPGIFLGSCS